MESRSLVKKLMKERKLTAEAIAFKAKRSYSTVTQWLAGREVTDETLSDFARAFELSVDELRQLASVSSQKMAM